MNRELFVEDTVEEIYREGFHYYKDAISPEMENDLLSFLQTLDFKPYVMRGQPSRRGIARFGHDYGPIGGSHHTVRPLPRELIQLRDHCGSIAGFSVSYFSASVVTEYTPGATIGWHSDMIIFGPIVFGVSLTGACTMKLRPKNNRRNVFHQLIEPRSLYVMEGDVRWNWEHSIPPVKQLRYSITFRTPAEK